MNPNLHQTRLVTRPDEGHVERGAGLQPYVLAALGALALGLVLFPRPAPAPPAPALDSIVTALERDHSTQAARDRLEFVGAMEVRLDRLDRVQRRLEARGVGEAPEHRALEELHDELAQELHDLKLHPSERWRNERERLLDGADRLQDGVLALFGTA